MASNMMPCSSSPSLIQQQHHHPPSSTRPTEASHETLSKHSRSLMHRSRRSLPSFLPSLQHLSTLASDQNTVPVPVPVNKISPTPSNPNVAQRHPPEHLYYTPPDVKGTMPSSVAYSATRNLASDHDRNLNGSYRLAAENMSPNLDERRPKNNEDIFLNIARSDSLGRADFRRSRLGHSSQGGRSPGSHFDSEQTPSPDQRLSNVDSPLLSHNVSPTIPYSSIHHSSAASAHPLDEPHRFRYSSLNSGPRSTIGASRGRLNRASPESSPQSPSLNEHRRSSLHESRLHRQSALSTIRSSRQPSTSEVTERARGDTDRGRADGTESTLSTTAPSTVWDELDDLKSRIRKLELTGKLPPSSQAAISSVAQERPRTAATTVTALSTSPRHHRKVSTPSADADNAAQNQVQPILHSALAKAKTVLSSDVYKALEVTITDALTLSTLLGVSTAPSGTVSVVNGGYSSSERHARRKADSVCRSLTELCLALTDEELKRNRSLHATSVQGPRVNGAENDSHGPPPSYTRAASHEPEGLERRQSISSRVSTRLEARRASLVNHNAANAGTDTNLPQSSPNVHSPPSRLHRISTSLRTRRPTEEEHETPSQHSRSLSRAMTELGAPSPAQSVSPQQRSFRHSASRSISISNSQQQEPGLGISPRSGQFQPSTPSQAPSSQPRTPTFSSQTGIPSRRSLATSAVYSPATSRSNIQAGSRRYGLSPGFSNATPRSGTEDSPRSPQPEQSQTRISIPSGKTVTSYTPIQQPRHRTNSLGARKFGLRRRSTAPEDAVNLEDSID